LTLLLEAFAHILRQRRETNQNCILSLLQFIPCNR
jgi:hypothetical protein